MNNKASGLVSRVSSSRDIALMVVVERRQKSRIGLVRVRART